MLSRMLIVLYSVSIPSVMSEAGYFKRKLDEGAVTILTGEILCLAWLAF